MDFLQLLQLPIIQGLFFIAIIVLGYRTMMIVFDARTAKGYVLKQYLHDSTEDTVSLENVDRLTFLEKLTSIQKYLAYTENELRINKSNQTVKAFILKRLMAAVSMMLLVFIVYGISRIPLFLYIALPIGILSYKLPKKQLSLYKDRYIKQLKFELRDYLAAFGVLLKKNTPFEATKKSIHYAGTTVYPFVSTLVAQINLSPASIKPYLDFAESVESREAREFVMILNQVMKVDGEAAKRLIDEMLQIMSELQDETYNEILEERPGQVDKYIFPLFLAFGTIIFTFIAIMMSNSFTQIL